MRYQRASEAPKFGKTDQEERMLEAFEAMRIKALSDYVICFLCGQFFKNPIFGNYPHSCLKCGGEFVERRSYCMPDILMFNGDKVGVVYVNGGVHEKEKVRKKDKDQIQLLRLYGYVPFIIKNTLIDNSENFYTRAIAFAMYNAIAADWLYKKLLDGERELYGLL